MSMSTKTSAGQFLSPTTPPRRNADQLRRDRRTAIIVMAIMLSVMAVVLWLASLLGSPIEPVDYWPIMM